MKWLGKFQCVRQSRDKFRAQCCVCIKEIDVTQMGESTLTSHEKGAKHKKNVEAASSTVTVDFFKPASSVKPSVDMNNNQSLPPPPTQSCATSDKLDNFLIKKETYSAELLWTMNTIFNHHSYRSNTNISNLFKVMFPDSAIAKQFACGEKKTAYLTVYGLAPHFKETLKNAVKGAYSVMFDESLNKSDQTKQMDIHLRFWNDEQKVVSRYFTSEFLGHATAQDMVDHFTDSVLYSGITTSNMVQISMDGPNVNWKFYDLIKVKLSDDFDTKLLNIGSCGLHTVHNSFKSGAEATGWRISDVLSSLYHLFKNTPARREDFTKITGCSQFPLKFVNHRWLENVPVAERAIDIWNSVEKYVKEVEVNKSYTKPSCKSYDIVRAAVKDILIIPKLHFFNTVAKLLEPFLTDFQTESPMVCFLASGLQTMITSLLRRFIKPEVLESASTTGIDPEDQACHVNYSKIEIGFCTEKALKRVAAKLSDKQKMEFRMMCKDFLIKTSKILMDKTPLKYSLVKHLSALDPRKMVANPEQCKIKFKKVVSALNNAKKVKDNDCDRLYEEYCTLLEKVPLLGTHKFSSFTPKQDRLDVFLVEILVEDTYPQLRSAVKLLLVISHGQADVERGFSVNKEIVVENLKQESLVAQRIICDHVKYVGGVTNVKITQELLTLATSASSKYHMHLKEQKEKKISEEKQLKRKAELEEIDSLQKKKAKLQEDISMLEDKAEKLFEKAETTGKITFVTEGNVLRKGCKDKIQQVAELDLEIKKKKDVLK